MKRLSTIIRPTIAMILILIAWIPASADYIVHHSEAKYLLDAGKKTAKLTYVGDLSSTDSLLSIPETITYNGITYTVTEIAAEAAYNNKTVKYISFPETIISIGDQAFRNCSLREITIPKSVTQIGKRVFGGNDPTSITVEEGNNYYDSRENCNAIINSTTNELITGCCNTTIPNSVTKIGDYAFDGRAALTSIIIPDSVSEIGVGAFIRSALTSVTIPNSVTKIGDFAFSYCHALTSIIIPDSVSEIADGAFYSCDALTSIIIPDSVTKIGPSAFSFCASLTSIIIPDSVSEIGRYAFSFCYSLTSATIGNSVTKIGDSAFEKCYSLTSIKISDSVTYLGEYIFFGCHALTSIIIPDSVSEIAEGAFYNCIALTSVTIGKSVTKIGSWAFFWTNLMEVASLNPTPPECHEFFTFEKEACFINKASLSVPEESIEAYKNAPEWRRFYSLTGVDETECTSVDDAYEVARYDINGRLLSEPAPGINIIKMSDGTTLKTFINK